MSAVGLLPLSLLGAMVGLDMVSFPQAMLSRPIVAATLGGALVGSATHGLIAGVLVELVAFETLPVGASRYPEWGSAGVVGGSLYASHPGSMGGGLLLAVLAAVVVGWAGAWSMYALRRLNGRWALRARAAVEAGDVRVVNGLQIRGLCADLARGGLLTGFSFALMHPLMSAALRFMGPLSTVANTLLVGAVAGVALGAAWTLTHGAAHFRWYLLGGLVAASFFLTLS